MSAITLSSKPLRLAGLATVLFLHACSGDTLGTFSADEDLPETRIPGAGLATVLPGQLASVPLNVEADESFQGEDYDFLTGAIIKGIELRISDESENADTDRGEDGMPDDFSFLSSMSVYIQATIAGEQRRELVGSLMENDERLAGNPRAVQLRMTRVDVLPFIESGNGYQIQIEAGGSPPPDDVVFGGTLDYRVSIGFR